MIRAPFATAVSVAFLAALGFYPALGLGRGRRLVVLAAIVAVILLTPRLIPADRPFLRLLAAVPAVTLSVKLYDLHIGAARGHRPGPVEFVLFLPNLASIVLRKLGDEPRPGRAEDVSRLIRGCAGALVAGTIFAWTFGVDWRRWPFVVEHGVKVVALFLTLVLAATAGVSAWRLLGLRAREPVNNPFASRTPADFWKRYNRPAQQFLYEDVFRPLGGRRAPIRGTLATFAVSAAVHEYIFDIAVGRFQGYQTAFFLIQGLAVALTLRVRPTGRAAVAWVAATFAFNLATSALFFASVGEVVPFYATREGRRAGHFKKVTVPCFSIDGALARREDTRTSGCDNESRPDRTGYGFAGGRPSRGDERSPGR